jgi:hypothetical protein
MYYNRSELHANDDLPNVEVLAAMGARGSNHERALRAAHDALVHLVHYVLDLATAIVAISHFISPSIYRSSSRHRTT